MTSQLHQLRGSLPGLEPLGLSAEQTGCDDALVARDEIVLAARVRQPVVELQADGAGDFISCPRSSAEVRS